MANRVIQQPWVKGLRITEAALENEVKGAKLNRLSWASPELTVRSGTNSPSLNTEPVSQWIEETLGQYELIEPKRNHAVIQVGANPVSEATGSTASAAWLKIQLGANQALEITENWLGSITPVTQFWLLDIELAQGAQLKWGCLDWNEPHSATRFRRIRIHLAQDSRFEGGILSRGSAKEQTLVWANLSASGAEVIWNGASVVQGVERLDHWFEIHHEASHTTSRVEQDSIARDQSYYRFNGNVLIPKGLSQIDAFQKNKNLLLSERAVVETDPKLEIASDDVKCAHGASVSPVSDEQLYYLESRGISKTDALEMIVSGVSSQRALLIPDLEIRNAFVERLSEVGP